MTEVLYGLDAAQRERVGALRAQGRFFWLDVALSDTTREEVAEALGLAQGGRRALSACREAGSSRAFHADGESVAFTLSCYVGEVPADQRAYRLRAVQVRVVVTGDYLLTLHEETVSLPATLAPDLREAEPSQGYLVYAALDAMLATGFDALEEVELKLDALAGAWTGTGVGRVPRATLREAGARLATMRRSARSQQTVFDRVGLEIVALRGFGSEDEPYLDRLEEQADRLLAAVDAAANGMGMLLDLQLNERAYLVSVVATIFVPLTFVTGFFGMNFGWMIDHIRSPTEFWILGFIVPIAVPVLSWRVVARWLLGDDDRPRRR